MCDPLMQWQVAGFALYVHWPFCESKCPYCDFNSHVALSVDHADWRRAYLTELRRMASETQGRTLTSIYFGGGTPSLMEPATVAAIIDEAARLWTQANDIEITLEANPSSVEIGRLNSFRVAGVNRVSIGVQALNDPDLRRLGRKHNADEALAAIAVAQAIFDRTSFDLIYARQDQSLADWERELSFALEIAHDHLSLYQLTVEPGTVFAARYDKGLLAGLPEEDLSADMYLLTQDLCEAAGRPAYEVSNHAKPGDESRHNMVYWNCGDYIGIGPGAHGRITNASGLRSATACIKSPVEWLAGVPTTGVEQPRESLSRTDQAAEYLLMGLRLTDGIDLNRFASIAGEPLSPSRIQDLEADQLVTHSSSRLKATTSGRMVLNSVLKHLLA